MAQKLVRYIDIEEFKKLLAAEKDRRYKLMYVLGFGSGLRISEILGYKGKSIKKDKKTGKIIEKEVDIPRLTKKQIDLEAHRIKILGKGAKERMAATNKWLNKSNIELLPIDIPRRTVQGRFTRLCEKTLGRKLSFHTLRHGWANYLINVKKLPAPQVQMLGGWSRLDTLGIYAKANPADAIDAAYEVF